jgi:alpha-pyrone synthase
VMFASCAPSDSEYRAPSMTTTTTWPDEESGNRRRPETRAQKAIVRRIGCSHVEEISCNMHRPQVMRKYGRSAAEVQAELAQGDQLVKEGTIVRAALVVRMHALACPVRLCRGSSPRREPMLIDVAVAVPPYKVLQTKATEELKSRMAVRPAIARMIDSVSAHSGIDSRYVVVPDAEANPDKRFYVSGLDAPGTKARMDEYETWSKLLATRAAKEVLEKNAFKPEWIERLITISCTGFFAPGLDTVLIKDLGLSPTVRRTHIGFMGCAASLVGFGNVLDAQGANGRSPDTLVVSVELCSLHLQTEPTKDNILANIIFADGAAAALFSNRPSSTPTRRLDLVRSASILFDNSSTIMGWKIGNTGFEMNLSQELPNIIRESAVPALLRILEGFGVEKSAIAHWALHPGGRSILDALRDGLGLSEEKMQPSRTVLRDYGNMSSASILFVLKEVLRSSVLNEHELCCAVGFGPGLTMEVILFKVV